MPGHLDPAVAFRGALAEVEDILSSLPAQDLDREDDARLVRLRDYVLSTGERVSVQLVAAALRAATLPAVAVDARDFIRSDDRHGEANVDLATTRGLLREAAGQWRGQVPVITGFIGRSDAGHTTTLGRDGSDYSAAIVAQGLRARVLQIWTDVRGVLTADPEVVPEARPIPSLSYGEALELSVFGARVLHPRTMVPLIEDGIVLEIRATDDPDDPGTRVDRRGRDDDEVATSVTSLRDLALIDVRLQVHGEGPSFHERVARTLEQHAARVWLVTHAAHGAAISAVVQRQDVDRILPALEAEFAEDASAGTLAPIRVRAPVSLVTLVAEAMGRTPNVAGRLFAALGRLGMNILTSGQSATARSISAVVEAEDTARAVRAVHDAFHIDRPRAHVVLLGAGGVGSALLDQLAARAEGRHGSDDLDLRVAGVLTTSAGVLSHGEVSVPALRGQLAARPARPDDETIVAHLRELANPILVDCTASDETGALHLAALRAGIHVVTANKKPLADQHTRWQALSRTARVQHRSYAFETTVGAGLPVMTTLSDLVRTGDRVHRVEGALSGTLGFVLGRLHEGASLVNAVREAQARGYTEPFPGEDLSGQDAGRKALILARAMGLTLEPEQVQVTPLVPAGLLRAQPLDRFYAGLAAHGPSLEDRVRALASRGRRLSYLAVVDAGLEDGASPSLRVGPTEIDGAHPAAGLSGSEAFISLQTDRYHDTPLIVRGPGAGNDVTAAGVLADILRIAATWRGG